jgi:hypothetical protein
MADSIVVRYVQLLREAGGEDDGWMLTGVLMMFG